MRDKNLLCLSIILLLKALIVAFIIWSGKIGLSPDEAQYWTWSQALDFGYYSKPPGIAWEIFLGTSIFQNNEFGVRFFALVIGFLLPIATYFLALESKLQPKTAFWCGIMLAFSPLGFASSFFATTDGSMVLFWTLSSIIIARGLAKDISPNYPLLGVVIALGALFKWPIYLFWIFPLFMKRFWNKSLTAGITISLLGLLPSFIWNWNHDFGTFKHVFSTVKGGETSQTVSNSNFFDFLGAQAGLVSPILFVLLLISVVYFIQNYKEISKPLLFCFISSFSVLAFFLASASFKKMQGNWAVFAYPAAFVCLGFVMLERKKWGEKWIKAGVFLSIILTSIVVSIPFLQANGYNIPYKLNAFRHNVGWSELPKSLKVAGYKESQDFLFGDKYQMSSILSFYNEGQKRAYFLNLHGIRNNQFSYWTSMHDAEIGKTGYFVLVENTPHLEKEQEKRIAEYQQRLSDYFEGVQFMGIKPLVVIDGEMVKGAFIFKGTGYNGNMPPDSSLY